MNNKKHYDVAIVGGGAAGMLCALLIKEQNPNISVAILEAQQRIGKKLMVTGNGRCNLTNMNITPDMYHGSIESNISEVLNKCTTENVLSIFERMGLLTTIENDGRVYPLSKQANSVLDILRLNLQKQSVDIFTEFFVTNIETDKSGNFIIHCSTEYVISKNTVIATGGKAAPSTGADTSIFSVLRKLGHTITPLSPALSPVNVNSQIIKSLKGIRAAARVSIIKDNKVLKAENGEVQFTDKALSGICIFNLSRIANTEKNTQISIALIPEKSYIEILDLLKFKSKLHTSDTAAENLLIGFFNKMIGIGLLKSAGISPSTSIGQISDNELRTLARVINDWRFDVVPTGDFTKAQVTAGGVSGQELSYPSMESKKVKNLYIIGEAVDCDGDCGGMNLQFAFASAYCAASDITLC